MNLLKNLNGEKCRAITKYKCHQMSYFVSISSKNKRQKGWIVLQNQKGMIPKINQNQFCKKIAKMCFKIDVKFTLFLMLCVPVLCTTLVYHPKRRVSGIKKPFVSKGLFQKWCGKPESNRHEENPQQILSLLRLPVPPYPQHTKHKCFRINIILKKNKM